MYNKKIIVFEGIEGSGKSLHIKNVSNYLKKKGKKFIKIREPGGNVNSEKIRKLILNNKSKFSNVTDLLLYFAARNENIEKIINCQPNTLVEAVLGLTQDQLRIFTKLVILYQLLKIDKALKLLVLKKFH